MSFRRLGLVATLATGLTLTGAAYWGARTLANARLREEFDGHAAARSESIRTALEGRVRDLGSLRRFLEYEGSIDPGGFARLANPLAGGDAFQFLAWSPFVPEADRPRTEAIAVSGGAAGFRFRELDAEGHPRVADARPDYFPILLITPSASNADLLGLDLGQDPALRPALERASTSDNQTAALCAPAVRTHPGLDSGFLLVEAVMATPRNAGATNSRPVPLRGALVGALSLERLAEGSSAPSADRGVEVRLRQRITDPAQPRLECLDPSTPDRLAGPAFHREFEFVSGGIPWRLEAFGNETFLARHQASWPNWIPVVGLLLTCFAGFRSLDAASRQHRAETLVEQRTRRLRETEERLELTIQGADLGTWDWDVASGRVVYNERWARILGYSLDQIEGHIRFWEKAVHPEDLPRITRVRQEHLAGRSPSYESEHRLRHRLGHWVWVLDKGAVLERDAQGKPVRACGTQLDITARKESEKALERFVVASEQLRDAMATLHRCTSLDSALDVLLNRAIDLVGANGGGVYKVEGNVAVLHQHQGLPEAYLQTVSHRSLDADHVRAVIAGRGRVIHVSREFPEAAQRAALGGFRHIHSMALRSGSVVFGFLNLASSRVDPPDPTSLQSLYILGVEVESLFQRLRAEEQLRESQDRLHLALEAAQMGVWEWDLASGRVLWSPQCHDILGTDDFDGRIASMESLVHPEDLPAAKRAMQNALEEKTAFNAEFRIVRPDGQTRWIVNVARAIHDPRGAPIRVVGTVQDLSDRRRMEARFREVQRMEGIGQLAGGIAHEFNNILAAILLNQTLINGTALTAQDQESLSEIRSLTHRASNLVRQLLAFSQKANLDPSTLDLNDVLDAAGRMLRPLLGEAIQLEFIGTASPAYAHADRRLLEQVVLNLCLNARDAMPRGGRLALELQTRQFQGPDSLQHPDARPGAFACLRVTDSGTGMDDHTLSRLFQPFFTTKEVGRGTGLGLATAHGIVRQHQGWIQVSSQPGAGSTFEVYLPVLEVFPAAHSALATASAPARRAILLVEDEAALRRATATLLRRLGYTVFDAGTPAEARDAWSEHKHEVGLLLTDMVLPGGTHGADLARQFSAEQAGLRIIVSSGYNLAQTQFQNALPEGAVFLAKPCPPDALEAAVRSALT